MKINTDINVLGGLPNLELVTTLFRSQLLRGNSFATSGLITSIKTEKSITRFKNAAYSGFLSTKNERLRDLVEGMLKNDLTSDGLLLLFLAMSVNNDLFRYLNSNVLFPGYYSGRSILRSDEVSSCIKDLREREAGLQKWSDSTIRISSYKYLALCKKFGVLEGGKTKKLRNVYFHDPMFICFVYWLIAVEEKPDLMNSQWLQFGFSEQAVIIERILERKFSKFLEVEYTGDRLSIQPLIPYKQVYDASRKL